MRRRHALLWALSVVGLAVVLGATLLLWPPSNGSRPLPVAARSFGLPLMPVQHFGGSVVPATSCEFNAVQAVTIGGSPTGGSFTLAVSNAGAGTQTATIAYTTSLSATTVQTDLAALSNVGVDNVSVTGPNGGPFMVSFVGPILHTVDKLVSTTALTPSGTVTVAIIAVDQTHALQNLINNHNPATPLILGSRCWEIDGDVPAGTLTQPLGSAGTLTTGFGNAGTLTCGTSPCIANGATVTTFTVTSSGSVAIPGGSSITVTGPSGINSESFVTTAASTPPGSTTFNVTSKVATSSFNIGSQVGGGSVSQLLVTGSAYDLPSGTTVTTTSNGVTENFTTVGDTPPAQTFINVTAKPASYFFPSTSKVSDNAAISSLFITASTAFDIPASSLVKIYTPSGSQNQTFTTIGDTPAGSLSIRVHSIAPNAAYNAGIPVTTIGNLHISNTTGLTVDGNGATLVQTQCQPPDLSNAANPIIFATGDTGLRLENLTVYGAIGFPHASCPGASQNNGPSFERDAGLIAEAEVNLVVTHVAFYNTQGDGVELQEPNDYNTGLLGPYGDKLNTNVVFSDSIINSGVGGYHCFVVEAVGPTALQPHAGATIVGDEMDSCATEVFDFEADLVATPYGPDGFPLFAAEDDITISGSTFVGWTDPLLASIQAYGGGVQEQNLIFTGNILRNTANSALFEVAVTPPCCTGPTTASTTSTTAPLPPPPPRSWSTGWKIDDNREVGPNGAGSIFSGTPCVTTGIAISIKGLAFSEMENNTFPIDMTSGGCSAPYIVAAAGQNTVNFKIQNNNFTGALFAWHGAPGEPLTGNTNVSDCGNYYGAPSVPPTREALCP